MISQDFLVDYGLGLPQYLANEEINLRIKQVDGFLTKLTDFQERCNILKQEKNINFPLGKRLVYAPKRKILLEKQ